MNTEESKVKFFLGTNSPIGFVSRFNKVYDSQEDWRVYIIKGGPGTGKSNFIKKVCSALADYNVKIEHIFCASDPKSYDAIILPEQKIFIADGTSPHVLEPKYPGAVELLLNFGDFFDDSSLYEKRKDIITITKKCAALHERATRFIGAAGSLLNDTYRLALDCTDIEKILRYSVKLSMREFKPISDKKGTENIRFLSAITPEGIKTFKDTADSLCERLFIIKDEWGASSRILLSQLRSLALNAGYDIITCYCPLAPNEKIEHIFIPSLSLGFVTSNRWHSFDTPSYRTIHAQRFTDYEQIKARKQRISFNKRAATELIMEAAKTIEHALSTHDELERYYVNSMNYKKLDKIFIDVINKIKKTIEISNQ